MRSNTEVAILSSVVLCLISTSISASTECLKDGCTSLESAKQCNTLSYCLPTWKNQSVDLSHDFQSEVCKLSESIINNLQNIIELFSNHSKGGNFEQVTKHSCKILSETSPSKYVYLCYQIMGKYFAEVKLLIKEKINPQLISILLGNCEWSGASLKYIKSDEVIQKPLLKKSFGVESAAPPQSVSISLSPKNDCAVCKQIMDALQILKNKNATLDEMAYTLGRLCSTLETQFVNHECNKFMDQHSLILIHTLLNAVPVDRLCQFAELCAPEESVAASKVQPLYYIPSSLKSSQNVCALGPKYWCRSKEDATACGDAAVKLCDKLFWRFWNHD